jgi:hypothetical protein
MVAALLLHSDEGFWAGDRPAEGKVKDLVTGDWHFVEFKGKEPFPIRNYARLLVTGNQSWLVPAGMEERRWCVLDVGEDHMQDHAYFAAIEAEMETGGREALLDHLLRFDLARVNLRQVPKTAALLDQKIASLSPEMAWLLDFLRAGELPPGCDGETECPRAALYDAYVEHARAQGVNRRSIETAIGRFLVKTFPRLRLKRPERNGVRVCSYLFPPLAECRDLFAALMQQKVDWADRPKGGGFVVTVDEWDKAERQTF